MKVIADEAVPYLRGVLEPFAEVVYMPGSAIDSNVCRDADALIIRTRTRCDAQLLGGSRVSFIGTATIGIDHINKEYCAANGIETVNAPGCNSSAVQQYIATALLKIAELKDIDLKGKTLGIVGLGHVGSRVKRVAEWIGMKTILNDPPLEARGGSGFSFVPLSELLERCDAVTLHVPLDDTTFHLADSGFFRILGPGKIFINASRGDVADGGAALDYSAKALAEVIDVWPGEPKISLDLLRAVDIATPHIAGYSMQGKINGTVAVVRALARHFGIEPLLDFALSPKIKTVADPKEIPALYDIMADDAALRQHPEQFEDLRNKYDYRYEFIFD
jgi:erythronate-4-phosphate dehydrogenase